MLNLLLKNWKLWLLLSLSLGLAPFSPEPHLYGKLKWIYGGGEGMVLMDYIDLFMHGLPWLFLFISIVLNSKQKNG